MDRHKPTYETPTPLVRQGVGGWERKWLVAVDGRIVVWWRAVRTPGIGLVVGGARRVAEAVA